MKRKTTKLILIPLFAFAMSLAGCGSYTGTIDKEIETVENNYIETDAEKKSESKEQKHATVEESVILNQNDIVITAKGIESTFMGIELNILIENNSDKNLTFQTRNESVNGFMADAMFSEDVAAGKKSNTSITFIDNGLEDFGIDMFAYMEFYFHVFYTDNWDEYFDSDLINVETSIASTYEQKIDDSGNILYESNDIKIVAKGLSFNDSYIGPGLVLYIENNSDKDFTVQVDNVSVNGFMINTIMSQDVIAGKKAIDSVTFLNSSLEENGITDIENIEISFHIFNMNTWDDIVDTEPIIINF